MERRVHEDLPSGAQRNESCKPASPGLVLVETLSMCVFTTSFSGQLYQGSLLLARARSNQWHIPPRNRLILASLIVGSAPPHRCLTVVGSLAVMPCVATSMAHG